MSGMPTESHIGRGKLRRVGQEGSSPNEKLIKLPTSWVNPEDWIGPGDGRLDPCSSFILLFSLVEFAREVSKLLSLLA